MPDSMFFLFVICTVVLYFAIAVAILNFISVEVSIFYVLMTIIALFWFLKLRR